MYTINNFCFNELYYMYEFAMNLHYKFLQNKIHTKINHIDSKWFLNRHASMIEIVNNETGEYLLLDFGDPVDFIPNILNDPKLKGLYTCQYHIYKNLNDSRIQKFTYMERHWGGVRYFKDIKIPNLIPKLSFIGTILPERQIIYSLKNNIFFSRNLKFQDYVTAMKSHKVAFTPPGGSDISLRDCEAFGMGVPTLRKKYKIELYDPLIENVHYISYDEDEDIDKEVQNIINRFNSVVNNDDFLSHISNNAKEWYDRNISNDVIIKTTFNRLDENNI